MLKAKNRGKGLRIRQPTISRQGIYLYMANAVTQSVWLLIVLHTQFFAPLGPARPYDRPAAACFHANAKTVSSFSFNNRWLICTLHTFSPCIWSIKPYITTRYTVPCQLFLNSVSTRLMCFQSIIAHDGICFLRHGEGFCPYPAGIWFCVLKEALN
jgi:hypothetical protein